MHRARIAELLEPFLLPCHSDRSPSAARRVEACPERSRREPAVLSPAQLNHISTYIDILQRWNARINLTAIRDEEEIVTRHFGESLFAAQHLFPRRSTLCSPAPALSGAEGSSVLKDFDSANDKRPTTNDPIHVADIGSGAGFPGIPIKLWAPEISLTLIESNHKKATFLREVIRALKLTNINVFPARAEQLLATHPTLFDVVTLRAVERFTEILPTAAALLAPGGRLALLIGSSQLTQAHSALPDLKWQPALPIPQSKNRILQIA
jgi:16S rRNA (guanine527-N7)-methyltransferase